MRALFSGRGGKAGKKSNFCVTYARNFFHLMTDRVRNNGRRMSHLTRMHQILGAAPVYKKLWDSKCLMASIQGLSTPSVRKKRMHTWFPLVHLFGNANFHSFHSLVVRAGNFYRSHISHFLVLELMYKPSGMNVTKLG